MAENENETVSIDGKSYPLNELSDTAKTQLSNIRFVDKELSEIKNRTAVLQAARQYYAGILAKELPEQN